MKFRLTIILSLLMLLALAACTTPSPAVTTEGPSNEPQSAATATAPAEVYPAPAQESAPQEAPQPVAGQPMYPDPQSGDIVNWSQAVAMLKNAEVTQIVRSQTLELTLNLKDGRSLVTNEPNTGELQIVLDSCGDVCSTVEVTGP